MRFIRSKCVKLLFNLYIIVLASGGGSSSSRGSGGGSNGLGAIFPASLHHRLFSRPEVHSFNCHTVFSAVSDACGLVVSVPGFWVLFKIYETRIRIFVASWVFGFYKARELHLLILVFVFWVYQVVITSQFHLVYVKTWYQCSYFKVVKLWLNFHETIQILVLLVQGDSYIRCNTVIIPVCLSIVILVKQLPLQENHRYHVVDRAENSFSFLALVCQQTTKDWKRRFRDYGYCLVMSALNLIST